MLFLCQATIPLPSIEELLHQANRKRRQSLGDRLSQRILQDAIVEPNPECVRRRSRAAAEIVLEIPMDDDELAVPKGLPICFVQRSDDLPVDFWQQSVKKIVIREAISSKDQRRPF